jgi:hypothetical protein
MYKKAILVVTHIETTSIVFLWLYPYTQKGLLSVISVRAD